MDHLTDSPRFDFDIADRAARGGGAYVLHPPFRENWAWVDTFTADECDSIIQIARRQRPDRAETWRRDAQSRRDSEITFLYRSGHTEWMFRRLADTVRAANTFFDFDLTCMGEGLQFTEYRSPSGKYDWHADSGPNMPVRKLSLTIQLTDPDDYDGGELELSPSGDPITMEKTRGRAFAFPSWTLHRVNPVTRGVRHSLVVWVAGPAFK